MAIIHVDSCWPSFPVENWRIFVVQNLLPGCPCNLVGGNKHTWIRQMMLEFSPQWTSTYMTSFI